MLIVLSLNERTGTTLSPPKIIISSACYPYSIVISLNEILSKVPYFTSSSRKFSDFLIVVPSITVSNLGVANSLPKTKAILADAASSKTLFGRALIP